MRPILSAFLLLVACAKTAAVPDLSKNHLLLRWSETEDKQQLRVEVLLLEGSARRCRELKPEVKIEANGVPLSLDFAGGGSLKYARGDAYYSCDTPTARATIPAPKDNQIVLTLSDGKGAVSAQYEWRTSSSTAPKIVSPADLKNLRAGEEVQIRWPVASKGIEQLLIEITSSDPEACQEQVDVKPSYSGDTLRFTLPAISAECRAAGAAVAVSGFYDADSAEQLSTREAARCEGVAKCLISDPGVIDYIEVGAYAKD